MNARILAARAPFTVALAIVLGFLLSRSSLTRMLPFATDGIVWIWIVLALALALAPALVARDTPLPATALVVVPTLAASSYGASRLDWLRVLKDFGVAEGSPVDFLRLLVAALALVLAWALHAVDLSVRLRERAIERGIARPQAQAAARRSLSRSVEALGLALAGAAGLLVVALVGVQIGRFVPTERGAFVVPLLAAALLAGAAVYLARGQKTA